MMPDSTLFLPLYLVLCLVKGMERQQKIQTPSMTFYLIAETIVQKIIWRLADVRIY